MSATARRYRARAKTDLRALREEGCTCRPDLHAIPRDLWPDGVTDALFVHHQTGCVLGDRVAALNAKGITPSMVHAAPARCER